MVIDTIRYFEYVAREYVKALRRSATEGYAQTVARLCQVLPDLWYEVYRLHCPLDTVVDGLTYQAYEFLYDSVATKTGNTELEDRVVVAYGRSQKHPDLRKLFDEMEAALVSGESLVPGAEVFRSVIEHNCHALPRRGKVQLESAVASALGAGLEPRGAATELLQRLSARPKPRLTRANLTRLRVAVLPLLEAEPWPRMTRSSRQYAALQGMLGMDVGHFISHATCGTFDINTFPQDAEFNRGRSVAGRKYRMMESYVARNPGTFYFSRPVYGGSSWVPEYLEWGALILFEDRDELPVIDDDSGRVAVGDVAFLEAGSRYGWWIGVFRNQSSLRSDLCSEEDFRKVLETSEQVSSKLRSVLSSKLYLRRTGRARGIAAHYARLEEVEKRLSELGDFVKTIRRRLDERERRSSRSGASGTRRRR